MAQDASDIVIIGAGHGGVELCAALRHNGFAGSITLISDETDIPYQRPPLSKDYIKRAANTPALVLKPAAFYPDNAIDLRLGTRAIAIDRDARHVSLSDGTAIGYDRLVLATGARNRMPPVPGLDHPDTLALRSLADANRIVAALAATRRVTIIGGGFIGLEAASLLRSSGIAVDVVEMAPRLMQRAVSQTVSSWFLDHHRAEGSSVHLSTTVRAIEHGSKTRTLLSSGDALEADAVLLATGIVPNDELAAAVGLEVDNGVVVDAMLSTADPHISAIGDCAAYPSVHMGARTRLESVQNAVDHARALAARLTGNIAPYDSLPWFWSIQGAARLQIAGLARPGMTEIVREGADESRFSVFLFDGDNLAAVESVNSPADHMAARRLIGSPVRLTREQAADSTVALKSLVTS